MVPTLALVAVLVAQPARAPRLTLPPHVSFATTAAAGASAHESHGSVVARIAVGAFMIGQFTDITTTEYGIGVGKIKEANPLFRKAVEKGPVAAGIAKGTFAVVVSVILLHTQVHHPKATFAAAFLLTAVQGYVTWHNAQLLR